MSCGIATRLYPPHIRRGWVLASAHDAKTASTPSHYAPEPRPSTAEAGEPDRFSLLGFLTWIFDSMSNEAAESEDSESADEGSKVNVKNYVEVFADGEW